MNKKPRDPLYPKGFEEAKEFRETLPKPKEKQMRN